MTEAPQTQRLDKWLVYARFVRTRSGAAELVHAGRVRLNGEKLKKADRKLRAGDTLTLTLSQTVRVVEVVDFAEKRGAPHVARALYRDVSQAADED